MDKSGAGLDEPHRVRIALSSPAGRRRNGNQYGNLSTVAASVEWRDGHAD